VLNVGKGSLYEDRERAGAFAGSALFTKVYADEVLTLGGQPYGLLVGDYEFDHRPRDLELLAWLAEIAAFAQAPSWPRQSQAVQPPTIP